jgi:hypothetical protein
MQKKARPRVAILGGQSVDLIQLVLRHRHIDPNHFGRRRRRFDEDSDRVAVLAIRHHGCFTIRVCINNLSLSKRNLER